MSTMQPAERRAVAGASETAGSLVFRPRERPPTQLHQAPSRLQGSAPSPLSTISGAAEPKSLSRLLPNNGEIEPTKIAPSSPGHCSAALINARFWAFGIETRLLPLGGFVSACEQPTRNPGTKRLRRLLRLFRTSYIFEPA
jgi:hypothetical protein